MEIPCYVYWEYGEGVYEGKPAPPECVNTVSHIGGVGHRASTEGVHVILTLLAVMAALIVIVIILSKIVPYIKRVV
jgi:hypothetical protein